MKLTAGFRALSALELLLGASIVIGHNVFHVVPNEVPILFGLGLLSFRLRNGGWSAMGLQRPASWPRIVQIAAAAAVLRITVGEFIIDPLTGRFWPPAAEVAEAEAITGNIGLALLGLLLVWTFAAFGEEIAYRGYLLARAADLGGGSTLALWGAMVLASILFGCGHYYKGPSGVLDSGVAGLILAHGFIDTFAVTVTYLGWRW